MSNAPLNRSLFDQVMVPNYAPTSIIPVRGKGSRVWDQDGREYLDFAGGIAVTGVGHCHPKLVHTLKKQGDSIWHLSNFMTNEPALRLASKLTTATFAERVFFANSGSEANEAAFKLARRYNHERYGDTKHEIIAFDQSFHGRTLFTVSVGGQPKYWQGFGPTLTGITHLPYNDITALETAVSERTCAIVMEPLQGEGGVISADPAFVVRARELCNQHHALLVMDEVQTGMGRLGSLYGYQKLGVTPDILTTAKALGNGFPIAAMLTTAEVASAMAIGTHGSTFGGNPLACSIAEAVFDIINDTQVLAGVQHKHQLIREKLAAINAKYNFCSEIRGDGLLIGCALNVAYQGYAHHFMNAAQDQQLLVLIAGPDVVRMTPSLLIAESEIKIGLERFEAAVAQVVQS